MHLDYLQMLATSLVITCAIAVIFVLLVEAIRPSKNQRYAAFVVLFASNLAIALALNPHYIREPIMFWIQCGLLGAACAQLGLLFGQRLKRNSA